MPWESLRAASGATSCQVPPRCDSTASRRSRGHPRVHVAIPSTAETSLQYEDDGYRMPIIDMRGELWRLPGLTTLLVRGAARGTRSISLN